MNQQKSNRMIKGFFKVFLVFFFPIYLYGQDRLISIDISQLKKRKKPTIDSVIFNKEKLLEANTNNVYTIPEKLISSTVKSSLLIYSDNIEYTLDLNDKFLKDCITIHNISFYYSKKQLCYILTNCTSLSSITPLVKIKKIKKRKGRDSQ